MIYWLPPHHTSNIWLIFDMSWRRFPNITSAYSFRNLPLPRIPWIFLVVLYQLTVSNLSNQGQLTSQRSHRLQFLLNLDVFWVWWDSIAVSFPILRTLFILCSNYSHNSYEGSQEFQVDCRCWSSFYSRQRALANCVTLNPVSTSPKFQLVTDASSVAVGSALHQLCGCAVKPVAFFSRKLTAQLRVCLLYTSPSPRD